MFEHSPLRHFVALALVAGCNWAARAAAQDPPAQAAVVSSGTLAAEQSAARLDALPLARDWEPGDPIREIPRRSTSVPSYVPPGPPEPQIDPLLALQEQADAERGPTATDAFPTLLNFNGGGFTGVAPPDTMGDVGPSHYVQAINHSSGSQIRIYNKAGTLVGGPFILDGLIPTGPCATGAGDPVVLYDQYADRWLLTEFADASVGNHLCVYISSTGDPGGAYTRYDVGTTNFPDYPHYGITPESYFITTNESAPRVYGMNRAPMLTGAATTVVVTSLTPLSGFGFQAFTPADSDGIVPPPPGAPGIFARHVDTEAHGSPGAADHLDLFFFRPNYVTPASSLVVGPVALNITEFDSDLCGLSSFSCIPQPSGLNPLDPLREVVMHRLQYRNFRNYQTLVGTLHTDTNGANRAGIRWFELRNTTPGTTGTGWTLYQEGTFGPDAHSRWMASAALDGHGNMGLGYSISSSTVAPGIRYNGRTPGATLGMLDQPEVQIVAGGGSQGTVRWGDYASMSVDPADECTFWFTTEYIPSSTWQTRVASMKFDTCVPFVKGDLNQDLKPDLLFRNSTDGQNTIWLMNGTTRIGSPAIVFPTPSYLQLLSGVDDFNSDHKNDLVFWDTTTGAVEFWLMNGVTRIGAAVPISGAAPLATNWKLSATADFNRDGRPDIVWRNFSSQKIVIWTMNGTTKVGNITPVPDQAVAANWEIVAALDYNGDGYVDFLWYNPTSGKIVSWFMDAAVVRTDGNFTNPNNAGDNNWKVLASADYGIGPDGPDVAVPQPGSHDMVWRNATSGNVVVWHMDYGRNRTGGVFTSPTAPSPTPTTWTIVGPR